MTLTDLEWKSKLTPEQFRVLRQGGTEQPFSSAFHHTIMKDGEYTCVGCGHALFGPEEQFTSSCGWPSFSKPKPDAVEEHTDLSFGMSRTEIRCSNCGGHLGHVFDDGPAAKGGLRYCINGVALDYKTE